MPISKGFWFTPAMCGKKYVIIDDFKSNVTLSNFLNILDQYPVEVEIKGGFDWWLPDVIVITTNRSPWDWYNYNDRDDERQAVFRRITGAYRFDKSLDLQPHPKEIDIWDINSFLITPLNSVQKIPKLNPIEQAKKDGTFCHACYTVPCSCMDTNTIEIVKSDWYCTSINDVNVLQ